MAFRSTRYLFVPAVAAVLVLAGCAGSSPAPTVTVTVTAGAGGSSSSASSDGSSASSVPSITPPTQLSTACQLLTLKEAEAIVGTTLLPGQEGNPQQPSCTYNPDPKGTRTAQVLITTEGAATSSYDTAVRIKSPMTTVPGIGDEAHQVRLAIYFRKGTIWAGIGLVYLDDANNVVKPLQDAAKVVVSRLP